MPDRTFRSRASVFPSLVLLICTLTGASALMAQQPASHAAKADPASRADKLAWAPAPPIFPAGAQMVVLQGDPAAAGILTVRLKFPNGYIIPAHWHPTDEYVTVIKGDFLVGLGDKFSKDALLPVMKPGDFITAPAHVNHFAMAQGETIVQVHMMGPFKLTYVNPKDDPTM